MKEIQMFIDPDQEKQIQRRSLITNLCSLYDFDGLAEMGIVIIQRDCPPDECCVEAAFPPAIYPRDILSRVISTWQVVVDRQLNDAAFYYNQRSNARTHIGRVIDGGRVRSRWGLGGILCEHHPFDIPIYCGREIKIVYFREPK